MPCSPLLTALHPADMQTTTCCNLALSPSPRCQSQGSLLDCTPRPCTPLLPHKPLCVDCSPLLAALPCTLHGLLVADWKATLTRDDPENGLERQQGRAVKPCQDLGLHENNNGNLRVNPETKPHTHPTILGTLVALWAHRRMVSPALRPLFCPTMSRRCAKVSGRSGTGYWLLSHYRKNFVLKRSSSLDPNH